MQARQTAEEELQEQLDNMSTPEMKAKYKECREAEAQLASLEQKLGKWIVKMVYMFVLFYYKMHSILLKVQLNDF